MRFESARQRAGSSVTTRASADADLEAAAAQTEEA
jgi:hypothetical protein